MPISGPRPTTCSSPTPSYGSRCGSNLRGRPSTRKAGRAFSSGRFWPAAPSGSRPPRPGGSRHLAEGVREPRERGLDRRGTGPAAATRSDPRTPWLFWGDSVPAFDSPRRAHDPDLIQDHPTAPRPPSASFPPSWRASPSSSPTAPGPWAAPPPRSAGRTRASAPSSSSHPPSRAR